MSETTADEHPIKFEVAKSGRSKCRASGGLIEKNDYRIGLDVWMSGRMATAWMKPLPFLKDCCRVEYALNAGSQGSCRSTHVKFERGAPRFVATAGDPAKKAYFTLAAAGALLSPVVQHVGREAFRATQLAGLEQLAAADRAAFCQAFEVPKAEAAEFDRQHPPPPPPSVEKKAAKSPAKGKSKAAKARAAAEEAEEAEAGEEAEAEAEQKEEAAAPAVAAEGRPAKRARGASASAAAAGSAPEPAGPAGSKGSEGPAEDEGLQV